MKRLFLSVLGGFAIPFIYTITFGPLSVYINNEQLNYLLWIPIGWPRIIYYRFLFFPLFQRGTNIGDNTFFIIMIACNVALYGSFTYFLLWLRSHRKAAPHPTMPPLPPTFSKDK